MPEEYWDENRNYKFNFSEADKVFEVHIDIGFNEPLL